MTLASFKLTRACLAGNVEMTTAYLIGGHDYSDGTVHSYIWKLDFEKSPLRWEKVSNLLNRRYDHACTIITVRKEPYIMSVGGLSNAHMTYKAQVNSFSGNY